jgi:hypothetical protein
MALKPWLNEERHANYHWMVDLGVVPPVNTALDDLWCATRRSLLQEVARQRPPELAGGLLWSGTISSEHPELLSSQQADLEIAEKSGALYSIDTGITDQHGVPIQLYEEKENQ